MHTARLFSNGRSQAVRLPKECRFRGRDVYVHKFEGAVILIAKNDPWSSLLGSLGHFSGDFMEERNQPTPQTRKALLS